MVKLTVPPTLAEVGSADLLIPICGVPDGVAVGELVGVDVGVSVGMAALLMVQVALWPGASVICSLDDTGTSPQSHAPGV
jgi:hypothetical protein